MKWQTLKAVDVARENNLNLIRFVAASAVIFSHSYSAVTGVPGQDPVARLTGIVPGNLAVDVFFLISGYLVTKSLLSRGSVGNFILARLLRVVPALLVCTSLTALVLGPLVTSLPTMEYLRSGKPWNYIFQNVILLSFGTIPTGLPGVFADLPKAGMVNGSLWTLPFEVWMYVSLAALALVGLMKRRTFILLAAGLSAVVYLTDQAVGVFEPGLLKNLCRFITWFYAGAAFLLCRAVLPMSLGIALILAVLALVSVPMGFQSVVLPVAVAYNVFALAFLLKGPILAFNKLGDFSYGLYIYAWPIQQCLVAAIPGIHPLNLFVLAFLMTLVPAVISWFVIEKPALGLKDAVIAPLLD